MRPEAEHRATGYKWVQLDVRLLIAASDTARLQQLTQIGSVWAQRRHLSRRQLRVNLVSEYCMLWPSAVGDYPVLQRVK